MGKRCKEKKSSFVERTLGELVKGTLSGGRRYPMCKGHSYWSICTQETTASQGLQNRQLSRENVMMGDEGLWPITRQGMEEDSEWGHVDKGCTSTNT